MRKQSENCTSTTLVSDHSPTCHHYEKQCSGFFFDCCQVIDPCHRCHMARECCETKPPAVSSILCNSCGTRQPPSHTCCSCETIFSHSFCIECKIWTAADIHHCDGCGFCRVGKAEDIFHCDSCEACFCKSTQSDHVCAKTKLKGEMCPLCLESGNVVNFSCFLCSYFSFGIHTPSFCSALVDQELYDPHLRPCRAR